MSSSVTSVVVAFELALILAGLVLLWRLALSRTARTAQTLSPLPRWEILPSGFVMIIWCVLMGGIAGQFVALQAAKWLPGVTADSRIVIVGGGFQLGLLAGWLGSRWLQSVRSATTPWTPAPINPLLAGVATFLVAMPLVTAVSLTWQYGLEKLGLPVEQQELIELLTQGKSVVLVGLAVIVAPVSEELIFRAGLFRYARFRLPRWAALLLPACLFAALHTNLATFAPLVVLGVLLSLAYERTGNIVAPMIAHSLFNLNTVLLIFAGVDKM